MFHAMLRQDLRDQKQESVELVGGDGTGVSKEELNVYDARVDYMTK